MAQTWTADVFDRTHAHNTDLGNMEDNFATLKSLFSGAAAPASMAACHPWFDTTQHVLKVRDDGNTAWLGLMHGDASQKLWVYRNAAMDGWAIDAAVSDMVLALKGGATYTTGAATAGSWTVSGLTAASHNHQWYDDMGVDAHDRSFDSAGDFINIATQDTKTLTTTRGLACTNQTWDVDGWTSKVTPNIASNAAWRPAAAVGTLQYLDLT